MSICSWIVSGLKAIDPDDDLLAPIDARLAPGGGLLDAHLGHAGLDRLGHAAECLDLLDQELRFVATKLAVRLSR